jgi:ABC-type multidrug transport system ATPase subunit
VSPAAAARPLFAAEGVCKRYGDRQVLMSAAVWARPGLVHAIFGRNGCGKSTLLKCATGLVRMDQGVVHCAGRSFLRPRLAVLAGLGVFYLPDTAELPWTLSLGRAGQWVHERFGGRDVAPVFEQLALTGLELARPFELSGGERRRAALAMAVIRQPRVLLADEPFAGIAPRDVELIARALRELAGSGSSVVVTGHEVQELLDLADDITWMTAGTSHGLGTPDQSRRHDQFVREYLGPWSRAGAHTLGTGRGNSSRR